MILNLKPCVGRYCLNDRLNSTFTEYQQIIQFGTVSVGDLTFRSRSRHVCIDHCNATNSLFLTPSVQTFHPLTRTEH